MMERSRVFAFMGGWSGKKRSEYAPWRLEKSLTTLYDHCSRMPLGHVSLREKARRLSAS